MKNQKLRETFPIGKKDVKPTALAIIASGALQERSPKRHERWALAKLGRIARESFDYKPLHEAKLNEIQEAFDRTKYWHGTGRFQRHQGEKVDVLSSILKDRAIIPALDPFDASLGLTRTTSLSIPRPYARAYADMHSDSPSDLDRFIPAQTAANFYVVRPAIRHIARDLWQVRKHPEGFRAGVRSKLGTARERQNAMPQTWKAKTTSKPVNTMFAFSVGSDIDGNYPILFGIDGEIETVKTTSAIQETREVRVNKPVTLDHLTHIEVPAERAGEINELLSSHKLSLPVIPIEDVEQYVARQEIGHVLLSAAI